MIFIFLQIYTPVRNGLKKHNPDIKYMICKLS